MNEEKPIGSFDPAVDGVSVSYLGRIFKKDNRTVSAALKGLAPIGEKKGHPTYDFAESASRLAVPDESRVIEMIKRLRPSQLPVKIQKEFWDAARSRQKYLEDQSDLWRTTDVAEAFIEVFKVIRQQMNLLSDAVARETDITEKQRKIIIELSDHTLNEIRKHLIDSNDFERYTNVLDKDNQQEDIVNLFEQLEASAYGEEDDEDV